MNDFVEVGIGGRWALREDSYSFATADGFREEYTTVHVEGPLAATLTDAERILNAHNDLVKALALVIPYAETRAQDLSNAFEVHQRSLDGYLPNRPIPDDVVERVMDLDSDTQDAWDAVNAAKAALTKARTP